MSDEADKIGARAMRKALDHIASLPEIQVAACVMAAAHIAAEQAIKAVGAIALRADAVLETNPQGKQLAEATAMKRTTEFFAKALDGVVFASRNFADEL